MLLENPSDFHNQKVSVSGFLMVSWEGGGVFESAATENTQRTEHAVRLRIPTKKLGPLERYDGTFGMVVGRFDSDRTAGWGGFLTVEEISPLYRFRPPLRPKQGVIEGDAKDFLRQQVEENQERRRSERQRQSSEQ